MRQRMEPFGNTQVGVGAHAGFVIHRERDHARDVGLERERHQIEHQLEILGDIVRRADRRIRNHEFGVVRLLGHLHAAFDLANGVEIVADDDAVLHAEAGLQALRLPLHAIEDAAGFGQDLGAFLIGVALAEELLEDRARVAFLRQRLRRRAPCEARAALRGGELKRRQTRVLADVANGELVGADAGVRTALAEVPGLHAGQPALFDVGVRLGRFGGLVAQAGDDGEVLAERLERLQDRRHGEVRAGFLRRPADP